MDLILYIQYSAHRIETVYKSYLLYNKHSLYYRLSVYKRLLIPSGSKSYARASAEYSAIADRIGMIHLQSKTHVILFVIDSMCIHDKSYQTLHYIISRS
ncbi:hypothetical protein Cassandra_0272 [Pseudomonas phage Cassandra]|nr:hypothetical protein Cassandra_0272 [Pseudomonas phage Cassandra]